MQLNFQKKQSHKSQGTAATTTALKYHVWKMVNPEAC